MSKKLTISFRTWAWCLGFCLLATTSWAQIQNSTITPKINSPLSRFGLGDPLPQYFAASAAMGGLGTAWRDPFHLNLVNPASLASLQATAFEGGIYVRNSQLEGTSATDNSWGGNLQYLSLAFPLRNAINRTLDRESDEWNAGMALAISPITQVGYDIQLLDTSTPGVELSTNTLKGSGGLTKFSWATGVRYKGLSVGADLGFVFGKIINSRLVVFDSLSGVLRTEFQDDLSVRATVWNFGAQYAFDFTEANKAGELVPNGKRVIVGATLSNSANLRTDAIQFARRFLNSSTGATIISDTLNNDRSNIGGGQMPGNFSLGVHFQDDNRLSFGAEYGATAWSNYENELKPETLSDSYYLALGGEYIPNNNSYNSYWKRVRYRLGFRYATDPRSLLGEQVTSTSLTFGTGLPIILPRQQISFVNLAFEVGRIGVENTLEETFFRINLGFTLNDNSWFFKRKFN